MPQKIRDQKKRYHSLNAYVVTFVVTVMAAASIVSIILFNILDAFSLIKGFYVVPMLMPLISLCACIIIGSLLTAIMSGILLKPLNELKNGMHSVSKGNFSVRLEPSRANGEIAEIQNSFNIMAKELESTELFRNDFINDFSHEFKTPMVSVYGFAKQLKKGGLTKEQEQEYIDIILAESKRLINMSSDILLLDKLEKQEIITDKTDFDLTEELRRSILLLEEQWTKKNITIEPELEEVTYHGNPEMLHHIWINVIGNAIKYTPENGQINISLTESEKDNGEIVISVCDNGVGMDNETMSKIFEKFYQGDSSRSTGGNGLGLAMVKRIVTLCSGRIKVKSEKGKGTNFFIYLPPTHSKPEEKKKKSLPAIDTAGLK